MLRRRDGRSFVIIEKGNQVGGTWNDNIYPGCCCDGLSHRTSQCGNVAAFPCFQLTQQKVLSHLYSFSFEPNPNWTREYPGQEEIQGYLIEVAHKYRLYRHIRFNSAVEEAHWDDENYKWRVSVGRLGGKEAEIGRSYILNSDFLVSAVGQLNIPKYPSIPGLNDFSGKLMHSARWDWDYDIRGKRVGIIGTGATAAQIIPEIAQSCKNLIVFQRTPAWVMPRHDSAISKTRQMTYKYIPMARKRYRASLMDFRENVFSASFDPKSPTHDLVTNLSKEHMLTQLGGEANAALRDRLTPDYPFSCKRIIVSDDYYPSMQRDNVSLETRPISKIAPDGVCIEDGECHELDVIILATGFRTTQFLYPVKVFGIGDYSLQEAWSDGASAYLGITVPRLPNFAMLYGPNTNLAYNSLILQIEAQSLYITTLISAVIGAKRHGKTLCLEPKQEVVTQYNNEVQARLAKSTFADPKCTSWFKDEKGRITTNWSGSAIAYQQRTSYVDWGDFEILGTAGRDLQERGQTRWKRVVEETQVSNRMAAIAGVGAMAAWAVAFYGSRLLALGSDEHGHLASQLRALASYSLQSLSGWRIAE